MEIGRAVTRGVEVDDNLAVSDVHPTTEQVGRDKDTPIAFLTIVGNRLKNKTLLGLATYIIPETFCNCSHCLIAPVFR